MGLKRLYLDNLLMVIFFALEESVPFDYYWQVFLNKLIVPNIEMLISLFHKLRIWKHWLHKSLPRLNVSWSVNVVSLVIATSNIQLCKSLLEMFRDLHIVVATCSKHSITKKINVRTGSRNDFRSRATITKRAFWLVKPSCYVQTVKHMVITYDWIFLALSG